MNFLKISYRIINLDQIQYINILNDHIEIYFAATTGTDTPHKIIFSKEEAKELLERVGYSVENTDNSSKG